MTRPAAAPILVAALSIAACGAPSLDHDGDGRVTVVCLGDSNTRGGILYPEADGWCERLGASLPPATWRTINRGRNGATACDPGRPPDGTGEPLVAAELLARALAGDHPDVVIVAFVTNDVILGCTVEATLAALHALARTVEGSGAVPLIALGPPILPPGTSATVTGWNAELDEIDARIRAEFPAGAIIDFASGMTSRDFAVDGIHVTGAAQARRTEAARRALVSLAGLSPFALGPAPSPETQ
ncbi:MAG TPA: SGNH/GDSL hydrolase family protein [Candidatus Eisenbacteria bacterium]|nr:SGNH/GDSL hydrolase family protein [Candidatus Eisenbacteria bacterium]